MPDIGEARRDVIDGLYQLAIPLKKKTVYHARNDKATMDVLQHAGTIKEVFIKAVTKLNKAPGC